MPLASIPSSCTLRRVINAWGTATPFGVSRSDEAVAQAVASMLRRHVVMGELQAVAGERLAAWSGAQTGCVTHSSAAGLTLAVAACMTGEDAALIARLPDTTGLRRRVVLLSAHDVNYGQRLTQAIRLAGALPVACDSVAHAKHEAQDAQTAAVLAVESHLAAGSGQALTRALHAVAVAAGVPLILDGAAQDWRVRELVASGAGLVVLSAQKYLRAPTAGLVVGDAALVRAVDAQHGGIGRAMKPSKEAIAGVLAAIDARDGMDALQWQAGEQRKVDHVAATATRWPGVQVERAPDPLGNGFERLWLRVPGDAATLVRRLREGDPAVAVAPHRVAQGSIGLELTGVDEAELDVLCDVLARAIDAVAGS
jgi:uncharacterized pyridoxal phosphate-dependent enzyme